MIFSGVPKAWQDSDEKRRADHGGGAMAWTKWRPGVQSEVDASAPVLAPQVCLVRCGVNHEPLCVVKLALVTDSKENCTVE
jgi:hypothetical protein